jgi:hypothetical protein
MTEHYLRIYAGPTHPTAAAGDMLHFAITDYHDLAYTKQVNGVSPCSFSLYDGHIAIADLTVDAVVEVWRRVTPDQAWYVDFRGFFWDDEQSANANGTITYRAICYSTLHKLARATVAYPSEVANRSAFAAIKAETIAKTLVKYNATSSGTTADGRARTVTLTGISIEADAANGPDLTLACSNDNLLATLQRIASIGAGDFDLVATSPTAWEFRWYNGQLGADRSATVTFSLAFGNMEQPRLVRRRGQERTVAIVGGQGVGSSRAYVVRTGTDYDAGVRDAEVFVDARNLTTTAAYNARGDQALDENEATTEFSFGVKQEASARYGQHYFLGDKVTARFGDFAQTQQITAVTVTPGEGVEQVQIQTRAI